METTPSRPPATDTKRYLVHMVEQLHYCVDVLASDQEEATEIAVATDMKGEPDCLSFDVDELENIPADDKSFSPINECPKCRGRMEDFESESLCRACREVHEKATPTLCQASQELYDRIQDYLDVPDDELPEGLVKAMDGMEKAWRRADGTKAGGS